MFDDTIKLYAMSANDNDHFGDETEDDNDLHRFEDDEEEEEVNDPTFFVQSGSR